MIKAERWIMEMEGFEGKLNRGQVNEGNSISESVDTTLSTDYANPTYEPNPELVSDLECLLREHASP
jgi:hypothetical protein